MDKPPEFYQKLEELAKKWQRKAFEIRRTPLSEYGTHYGSFHRRMVAAALDIFILSLTILPISNLLTEVSVGTPQVNFMQYMAAMQQAADEAARMQLSKLFFIDNGWLHYFYTNTIFQLIGIFLYCMLCWHYLKATPGKWCVRLVVIDEKTGAPLSLIQGFWRCVGYIFSSLLFCLGFVWISFDKRAQGWHDKLASSIVIGKPKKDRAVAQG